VAVRRPGRSQGKRVRGVTRERLLNAAEDLFLTNGFFATAVDAIAHAAGYTTGAVYSSFGSKGELFIAVLERATSAQLDAVRAALAEARTDEQRLAVFSTALASESRWEQRIAATIEFLAYARPDKDLLARIRAAQEQADAATAAVLVALCEALGVGSPDDIDELAREVVALMAGFAMRALFDDKLDVGAAITRAINSLLTGDRSDLRRMRAIR
jgi:AcrR family transcriptional regulator